MTDAPYPTPETVASELLGTCRTLNEVLTYYGAAELENDETFCAALDNLVFCCTTCDWWFDVGNMSDNAEWVCDECEPDNDEG